MPFEREVFWASRKHVAATVSAVTLGCKGQGACTSNYPTVSSVLPLLALLSHDFQGIPFSTLCNTPVKTLSVQIPGTMTPYDDDQNHTCSFLPYGIAVNGQAHTWGSALWAL